MWGKNREFEHEVLRLLRDIDRRLTKFTSTITLEGSMSTSSTIPVPGTGVLNVNLFDNGAPFVPANFPNYTQNWAWSLEPGSDPSITFVTSADTTSVTVTVPASDVATSFTIGASGLDPLGGSQTPSLTVTLQPSTVAQVFTSSITLTSASSSAITASARK